MSVRIKAKGIQVLSQVLTDLSCTLKHFLTVYRMYGSECLAHLVSENV